MFDNKLNYLDFIMGYEEYIDKLEVNAMGQPYMKRENLEDNAMYGMIMFYNDKIFLPISDEIISVEDIYNKLELKLNDKKHLEDILSDYFDDLLY